MSVENGGVGFFGKLPTLGDFVSRRLPRQFIDPWDQWLQSSLRVSQDIHGDNWLSLFLVSPIWRFALSPSACGENAWAGVMMPSVDRVGRYYPLTLAQAIDVSQMTELFMPTSDWFAQLESAALSVLEERFDLDSFDRALSEIPPPVPANIQCSPFNGERSSSSTKAAYRCELQSLSQAGQVFPSLTQNLLSRFLPSYSFWATEGVHNGNSHFLCFEGMPTVDSYAEFIRGGVNTNLAAGAEVIPFCPLPEIITPLADIQAVVEEGNEPTLPNGKYLQPSTVATGQWQSYGLTEVGNRRQHNEDAMLNAPGIALWVVADGMGGHQSGDVASKRVVDSLVVMPVLADLPTKIDWICQCLKLVNTDLCEFAAQMQPGAVIGSTVVALLAKGDDCAAIWAGDSRLYQLRAGRLTQITRDHTLLDELMSAGNMTREEALQQVGANVITRAVGGHPELEIDVVTFRAELGDRYLLCSDGLDKELSDLDIAEGLAIGSCQQATEALITLALNRNGIDNITVVVVDYNS